MKLIHKAPIATMSMVLTITNFPPPAFVWARKSKPILHLFILDTFWSGIFYKVSQQDHYPIHTQVWQVIENKKEAQVKTPIPFQLACRRAM